MKESAVNSRRNRLARRWENVPGIDNETLGTTRRMGHRASCSCRLCPALRHRSLLRSARAAGLLSGPCHRLSRHTCCCAATLCLAITGLFTSIGTLPFADSRPPPSALPGFLVGLVAAPQLCVWQSPVLPPPLELCLPLIVARPPPFSLA